MFDRIMKSSSLLLIGILLLGCNPTVKRSGCDSQNVLISETRQRRPFDFDKFHVQKGQLGGIKIGMTIHEAEMECKYLMRNVDQATNFGFDGGSPAYSYYSGDEFVFGLIPKLNTDSILIIIAAHSLFQTENGLNPNASVSDLIKVYPDLQFEQDLMNGWEFCTDKKRGWEFVFLSDAKTRIGEYLDPEAHSNPKRFTTKSNWMVIR